MRIATLVTVTLLGFSGGCTDGDALLLRADSGTPSPFLSPWAIWKLELDASGRGWLDVDGRRQGFEVGADQLSTFERALESERFFDLTAPTVVMVDMGWRGLEVHLRGRSNSVRTFGGWDDPEEGERFDGVWSVVTGWIDPALPQIDPRR